VLADATVVLNAVTEDAPAPAPGTVGTLVSALVDLNPPVGGLDNVTDPDAGAVTGIAITATDTNGTWYSSLDGGATWTAMGAVSEATALLLAADLDNQITFQPSPNFSGPIANAITFRAWDQTSGTDGTTADTTVNGDSTAFSTATDSASLTVTAVNDAPVLDDTQTPLLNDEPEDSVAIGPVGTLVSALVDLDPPTGGLDNVTDPDAGAVTGIAITATDQTNGAWYWSANDGSTWAAVGVVADATALVLAADAGVRVFFQPAANYFGPATLTFRAWDRTDLSVSGAIVDTTTNGGASAFSILTDIATVTVTPVNDGPVTAADSFDTIGNTELRVDLAVGTTPAVTVATTLAPWLTPAADGVMDNDTEVEGEAFTVTGVVGCLDVVAPFDCTLPSGSRVIMETTGAFSFVPSTTLVSGAPTDDTFSYQVTDQPLAPIVPVTTTGAVTIHVYDKVWWVRQGGTGVVGSGGGTSVNPLGSFTGIALGDATDGDAPGDTIFVQNGPAAVTSSIVLEGNQHLLGEGVGLSLDRSLNGNLAPVVLVTPGTRPAVTSATDTVGATSAVPIEIRGLSLASTGSNAIDLTATAALGGTSLTISDNTVTGATAEGIDINLDAGSSGTLNLAVSENTLSATGNALDINRSGGTATLTITEFHDNVVLGTSGTRGILVNGGAGVVTFDANPSVIGIQPVPGGTTAIGTSGDRIGLMGMGLTNVVGTLDFANVASGTIGAGDLDIFTDSAAALSVLGAPGQLFTLNVTPGQGSLVSAAGPAAVLIDATVNLQLGVLSSANSAVRGVSLIGVAGTFSVPAAPGNTITNATDTDFFISGGTADVTYGGTITDDTGQLISIATTTGGTKAFTGAITDGNDGDGQGISLTNNTGATIRFSGGLLLSTGANNAFVATGGGTIAVCDEDPCNPGATGAAVNTLTTTTGVALNVASTTIGSNNLEFRSISSNGAASGITLTNTGASGGLKVKGDGGGSNNGSGGTIQNTTGAAIVLDNTDAVSLGYLNLVNPGADGIRITDINGFTLNRSTIDDSAGGSNDKAIDIGDFTTGTPVNGTITLSNDVIGPAAGSSPHDSLAVGISTGTSTWSITGTTFRRTGNAAINMEARGSSTVTAMVDGSTFAGAGSATSARGVFVNNLDDAVTMLFTIQGSTFTNNNIHIDMNQQNDTDPVGSETFRILNNTLTGANSHAINVFAAAGTFAGSFTGTISGNTIGNGGVASSGSAIGNGIRVNINGGSDATMLLNGNTIRQTPNGRGIEIIGRNGTGGLDVTVTNNDVNPQAPANPLAAILVQSNCLTVCNTVRADIRGNTVPAGATATDLVPEYLGVVESGASTFELVNTTGSGTCLAQLLAANTGSAGVLGGCALIAGPISTPP
jgi:hypothetical protein